MPEQIDRYEIRGLIKRGGMSDVYRAYDPRFQREVVVKTLPVEFLRDPQFRQRFEREAVIIARLQHQAIVPVFDFGDDDGRLFLVMRYMEGGSLRERLDGKPVPLPEVVRLLYRLVPALDVAHSENIVHRDLKPGNILFDKWDQPYLTDFGIVKLLEDNDTVLTKTGSVLGTPAYMSPEQVQGEEVDGRSDVYALGVILYEMLAGTQPYQANTPFSLAIKHLNEPVPRILEANYDLPPGIQVVIDRVLAKDREDRYQSGQALVAELDALVWADDKTVGAATVLGARQTTVEMEETAVSPVQAEEIEPEVNEDVTMLDTLARGVEEATMIDTSPQPLQALTVGDKEETERKMTVSQWKWVAGLVVVLLLVGGFYWGFGGGGNTAPAAINPTNADKIQQLSRLDKGAVIGAIYSLDGSLLALPSSKGIYLYDALTLDEVLFIPSEAGIQSVAFSPDGETLASGLNDNKIQMWRVATGSLLKTVGRHTGSVNSVAFSPDGETLASGSHENTVRLWQVTTGSLLDTLKGHTDSVHSVAFSPDGETLASGARDGTVRLWRVDTGSLLKTLKGHTDSVNSVAFNPDGEILASGSDDETVRLWRVDSGALIKTLEKHSDVVNSVDFSQNGDALASGSEDGTIRLWGLEEEENIP